jgi:hypothetical protein
LIVNDNRNEEKMKRLLYITLSILMLSILALAGCPAPDNGDVDIGGTTPGAVTLVGSKWSSGNLVFYDISSGNTMMTLDGTTEGITITNLLTANQTITGGTISGVTITTASISNNGTLTLPKDTTDTIVGRATTDTLTNKSLTSPTITDTMVNANVAMGTANVSAGEAAKSVTHGLASTPTLVMVSWSGDTGDDYYIYWSSANATTINFATSANITNNTAFTWVAWIAGE